MGSYDDHQIRDILLPYARARLTTDHVQYTEQGVEQVHVIISLRKPHRQRSTHAQILLETLDVIPLADATSFLLPTDPFEALTKHSDSVDCTPYRERWPAPEDAIELVRDVFLSFTKLRTESCRIQRETDPYDNLSELYRPMSPVLTRQARRETPKLGCTGALAPSHELRHPWKVT
ncbi:hypothetical protein EDC04DRAFT_290060 [Pisolithus marmoratus]|nr:hypothetical protein EDC04DRAFT_290060 [Pisolithus marmoratus]